MKPNIQILVGVLKGFSFGYICLKVLELRTQSSEVKEYPSALVYMNIKIVLNIIFTDLKAFCIPRPCATFANIISLSCFNFLNITVLKLGGTW